VPASRHHSNQSRDCWSLGRAIVQPYLCPFCARLGALRAQTPREVNAVVSKGGHRCEAWGASICGNVWWVQYYFNRCKHRKSAVGPTRRELTAIRLAS
jgi:hypothetical protein